MPARTPTKRLTPEARRDQLAAVAMEVTAEQGFAGLTLDEVARRAGVTRAAPYRYFPRGKPDLFLAAVDLAGATLTGGMLTDADVPLEERFASNVNRFIGHAMEPSNAWLVYRHARSSGVEEVDEIGQRYRGLIIAAVSQNHFGTPDPPPYGRLAIRSWLDFAETALDECRERGLDRDAVLELLGRTLFDAIDTARGLDAR